ncbi:MAG: glycosyltransferase [Halieaceae bacterium]|jgi:glycosyltransferase involved in cell wall biosynthesis|nr:glycosyltransferase [Halieaceae bacterium]
MSKATRLRTIRPGEFRSSLANEFRQYIELESTRYASKDTLRVDLHCHDHNSDQPDELWGRILGLPETWLKTKHLVRCLQANGSDVVTITNHNNARSCWQLLEDGHDVLVAAEFTCHFPELDLFCHVLAYGFDREQEAMLERKRQNIYDFLRYAASMDIPLVLPHPLYFYTRNEGIDLELFEKLAVMFQRFEVLNGQRDLWQSTLTLNWVQSLTPAKIRAYARKHKLNPEEFGVDPDRPKILTGGSDDHMGIFAGQCGSYLMVPNLQERLKTEKPSSLALEALRAGRVAPFGDVGENHKLNIALLDYFAQIATRIEDPGLLRILLHRGETSDKLACFAISNVLLELQKHKHTRKFFEFVHDALQGKKPNKMLKWQISGKYRFCIHHLEAIADSRHQSPEKFVATVNNSIAELFTELNRLMLNRIRDSELFAESKLPQNLSTEDITRNFELPSQLTALLFGGKSKHTHIGGRRIRKLMDQLAFPALISLVLTGASLASTRVLYQNRQFLNNFAARTGRNQHDCRVLYLTDTLFDKNGVSNSLGGKLRQIQQNDIAIDFLICHETAESAPHLHVVRPLDSFTLPDSGGQQLRIPDLMEIARIFYEGGYDRVACSTEGPMVLVSLFLKYKFNIPCFFFMHTDWLEYIKCTTNASRHERDRIRRLLRLLYSQFDGVFVLNSDHRDWLTGHEMQLERERVHLTAHHAPEPLAGIVPIDKRELFADATEQTPVLFIACRVSREKGLFDLPEVLALARRTLPDLRLVIAGCGPDEEALKEALPDAVFLGWLERERLAQLYAGLDLFVFPSRFDTFGNVLLEAFSYGMPAVAYNCKGPKDIIQQGVSGYLVESPQEMARSIVDHYMWPDQRAAMRANAVKRAGQYRPDDIMTRFVQDLGLPAPMCMLEHRSVA